MDKIIEWGTDQTKEWYRPSPTTDNPNPPDLDHRPAENTGSAMFVTVIPEDWTPRKIVRTFTEPERGIIAHHSYSAPTWFHCPAYPAAAQLLADEYGATHGKPGDVEDTHWTPSGGPGIGPDHPNADPLGQVHADTMAGQVPTAPPTSTPAPASAEPAPEA